MAEVKVSELAKSVGTPVERLLKQMQEAGLSHTAEDALVSDEEKQTLLAYLKSSHGEAASEPRKITLKRKTTTTLKTGSGSARKTVNVEVRKKRTYVKRDPQEQTDPDETNIVANEEPVQPEPVEVPEPRVEELAAEPVETPAADEPAPAKASPD